MYAVHPAVELTQRTRVTNVLKSGFQRVSRNLRVPWAPSTGSAGELEISATLIIRVYF